MIPRTPRCHHALPQRQRGAVLVLIVIALVSILMMAALALDGSHMLVNKTRLQNSVDAAALSGARTLSELSGGNMDVAADAARTEALRVLDLNAAAPGNGELAGVSGLALVQFADSVYGPFDSLASADARYVRVTVADMPLAGFFWGVLQAFGNDIEKAVAAIATAGPSPTNPCDLAPVMVCGQSVPGTFFGFTFGQLQVLKSASHQNAGIGPGNFQLLDFGSGGKTVRELMAGGGAICPEVGDNVQTKPGSTVGPALQGLDMRFGEQSGGNLDASQYPPDLVTTYNKVSNKGALSLNSGGSIVYGATSNGSGGGGNGNGNGGGGNGNGGGNTGSGGEAVSADSGGYITTASGVDVFDYNDWRQDTADCLTGGGGCQDSGVAERRILRVVIGQCSGTDSGTSQIPVLGFGCYFVLQPTGNGNNANIFGQFVRECASDGVPGPDPSGSYGPQIIQLYKTYLDSGDPSTDS